MACSCVSPMSAGVPGAATRTIYYGGGVEKEIDVAANTTTIRTYLPAGLGFVQETISGTAVAATAEATRIPRYFLQDHLGSAAGVMDDAGTVLQRLSYDPWGRRRNANGTDDASAGLGSIANAHDHTEGVRNFVCEVYVSPMQFEQNWLAAVPKQANSWPRL